MSLGPVLPELQHRRAGLSYPVAFLARSVPLSSVSRDCLLQAGDPLGDGGSALDFMAMKSYSDVSLDISVLGCLGRSCRAFPPRPGPGGAPLAPGRAACPASWP